VSDPDGAQWEWYVKLADADTMSLTVLTDGEGGACCAPTSEVAAPASAPVTAPAAGPTCC
jgi:hypothetical protein